MENIEILIGGFNIFRTRWTLPWYQLFFLILRILSIRDQIEIMRFTKLKLPESIKSRISSILFLLNGSSLHWPFHSWSTSRSSCSSRRVSDASSFTCTCRQPWFAATCSSSRFLLCILRIKIYEKKALKDKVNADKTWTSTVSKLFVVILGQD